ncbi:hypothetical protein G9C98_001560 [Cotesia typhae]|uniref:Uncharacterized protein n=1 Tax=Cotesia typhae TaxID=2053667 RepID=A0A8J5UT91_9HYME|nr:hypothetical protein G9C98_001560 [Cotesia typhae]
MFVAKAAKTSWSAETLRVKETISRYLPEHQQFTPEVLLKALPNLKYIIDLTNTTRYYDKQEFLKLGLMYKKVPVEGKRVPIQREILR